MDEIVVEKYDPNKVRASNDKKQRQQNVSKNTSPPSSHASTSLRGISLQTHPIGEYNDIVAQNEPFWVEVNPKPEFHRNDYEINEEEFNVVGIFGETGQGDALQYEVQFEDDHTATVYSLPYIADLGTFE